MTTQANIHCFASFWRNPTMKLFPVAFFLLLVTGAAARDTPARALETISTSDCHVIRHESYRARLDVFYQFLIEWNGSGGLDVDGVDRAIATGLVNVLNECDSLGRPKYAVQVPKDAEVKGREEQACSSATESHCQVLRGTTSIFLDGDTDRVQQLAYFVIGGALNDPQLLSGYTNMTITRAELLNAIDDNLVILTNSADSSSEDTQTSIVVKSALASAAASFLLTVGIAYVMYARRQNGAGNDAGGKSRLGRLQAHRRKFFQELHDEESNAGMEPGWMVTDADLGNPSITWSVSDLTTDSIDDSQSIRSTLPLDRIMEAFSDEELASNGSGDPARPELDDHVRYGLNVLSHWNDDMIGSLDEKQSTQNNMPPFQLPFRPKSIPDSIVDVSLSITPVTPLSPESPRSERMTARDLDSVTISLEGCQYLENDVETSDELDCSFSSDPTQGLDIVPCSLGPITTMNDSMMDMEQDGELLFPADDLDLMKCRSDALDKEWSRSHACNDGDDEAQRVVVETVLSCSSSDDEYSDGLPSTVHSIQGQLERAKTQLLLTYS